MPALRAPALSAWWRLLFHLLKDLPGVQDGLGDLHQLPVLGGGEPPQPPVGFLLAEAGVLHHSAFRPLDEFAVLQRLPQVGDFLAQRLEPLEPAPCHQDGRPQAALLHRLVQAGKDVTVGEGTPGPGGVVAAAHENERDRLLPADLLRRGGAVEPGQVGAGNDHVGAEEAALLDQLRPRAGDANEVAEAVEGLPVEPARGRVAVRNHDAQAPGGK